MKHINLTYFTILFIAISFVSVGPRAAISNNEDITLKEHVSSLSLHQDLNNGDIIKSFALDRSEMSYYSNNTVNHQSLQTNFQYPKQDLLIKQSLVIRENLRRTSLRLLTYLKN